MFREKEVLIAISAFVTIEGASGSNGARRLRGP
jgi:hypothetical protein